MHSRLKCNVSTWLNSDYHFCMQLTSVNPKQTDFLYTKSCGVSFMSTVLLKEFQWVVLYIFFNSSSIIGNGSIVVLLPLEGISLIWIHHHRRLWAAKLRHSLRKVYRMWHGASVFAVLLKGPPHSGALYETLGVMRTYSDPGPHSLFTVYSQQMGLVWSICFPFTLTRD